jgi:hypothetical protein
MTKSSKAWVWSQYHGVVPDDEGAAAPRPFFGDSGTPSGNRSRRGATIAAAMIIGLLFPKIAFLLLVFAVLMILSGMEPERFENFVKTVPGGAILLRLLDMADAALR